MKSSEYMDKKTSSRSWNDLFKTALVLMWLILINLTWQSTHPFLRLTGILLPIASFTIWLLVYAIKCKRVYFPNFFFPLLLLLPLQAYLAARAEIPAASFRYVPYTFSVLISFLLLHNLGKHGWRRVIFEDSLLGLGVIYASIELLLVGLWYRKWWSISGFPSFPPEGYRATGLLLGHPNLFAAFINLLIPLALVRLFRTRNKMHKVLWGMILLIFLGADYYTSSRGGWIGAAAALGITIFLYFLPYLSANLKKGGFQFSRLFSAKLIPLYIGAAGVLGTIILLLSRQAQRTSHRPLFSSRGYIWRPAWNAIQQSPFWGHGSGSFPLLYISDNAPPPSWISGHAHNLFLQLWLEFGIPGLVIIFTAGILFLLAVLRMWRTTNNARAFLAAVGGAFGGMLIHHLFDYAVGNPFFSLTVLLLCSLVISFSNSQQNISTRSLIVLPILLVSGGILAGGLYNPALAAIKYWRGIEPALNQDWETAGIAFCDAHDQDEDFPFYAFQCSLARAYKLYETANPNYNNTIELLTSAVQADPTWPVHTVNLAYLYWENKNETLAVNLMEEASITAPDMAGFHLNLGWMLEESGEGQSASEAYALAIKTDPSLAFSVFIQNTNLRIEASQTAIDMMLNEPEDFFANDIEEYNWLGKYYLFNSDLANAEASFSHVLEEDGTNVNAIVGLAKTFQLSGQMAQAQKYINTALFLSPQSFEGNIVNGQILKASEKDELAAVSFDAAFDILLGRTYSLDYYYNVYHEYAPQTDLVPEYINAGLFTETVEDLFWLANFHTTRGSMDRANLITKYLDNVATR